MTTTRKLFGTDGIRGRAGLYPLDAATALQLGRAAAEVLVNHGEKAGWPTVIMGKDTRQSGDMLEAAITAGLNSRGVDVRLAGVVPTPAVAYLTRELGAAFGVVISASHNPFEDNGVKFFGSDGYKLDDDVELAIERALLDSRDSTETAIGRTARLEDAADRYCHFVSHGHDPDLLRGLTIALDAANGAACQTSVAVLESLGAEVRSFHVEPNGLNINAKCGCTYPSEIETVVEELGADVGIAHDGDADRVLLCDEKGSLVDGDEFMAIAGLSLLAEGNLRQNTLVATVMSNAGLDAALEAAGGRVVRTRVGDRYVVEEMKRGDFNFGGEQSGHFVFRDRNTTGDGLVAAVELLAIMRNSGKPLSELRRMMRRFPQVQRNIRVTSKPDLETVESLQRLVGETGAALGDRGRVLLRYSGTEPLLRLLVEGEDADYIEQQIDRMAEAAGEAIGE